MPRYSHGTVSGDELISSLEQRQHAAAGSVGRHLEASPAGAATLRRGALLLISRYRVFAEGDDKDKWRRRLSRAAGAAPRPRRLLRFHLQNVLHRLHPALALAEGSAV
ncbi:hypothetical protein EVAR_67019_1 [Eumeta japonica]|uniref:Uncharacterized protein n=1 Tax=Eumeta variegata TaxID=151549 RepID=A0A4C1ZRY4_EUMVA|nr:hypothetical protein EVAR_67019_1 [Eumeta japonica]